MRLIDADALKHKLNYTAITNVPVWVRMVIDNQPTIDAVPVIRCKDCKWWYLDADAEMACEYTEMGQPKDGFCNWAERRSDDAD